MKKQLFRSRRSKMIGGVAGGIAEYFDIDPVIVRAIFIISAFGWGLSIVVYIALWIIIPETFDEPEYVYNPETNAYEFKQNVQVENEIISDNKNNRKVVIGSILIFMGVLFLLDNIMPDIEFVHIWPIMLIAFGSFILYNAFKKKNKGEANEAR